MATELGYVIECAWRWMMDRYPQQSNVVRAGRETFRERSDARNAAAGAELLTKLIDAAFGVLHHDAGPGKETDRNREQLRKRFARILTIKLRRS